MNLTTLYFRNQKNNSNAIKQFCTREEGFLSKTLRQMQYENNLNDAGFASAC